MKILIFLFINLIDKMTLTSSYWIEKLKLVKHPEGGYYRETYKSPIEIDEITKRSIATTIFYLIDHDDFSAFHKIDSDEIWHFYHGSSITLFIIDDTDGKLFTLVLGNNIEKKENLEVIVRNNFWFAAQVNDQYSYSLVGCTAIPGFEFKYFMLGKRDELISLYPENKKIIEKFTRI